MQLTETKARTNRGDSSGSSGAEGLRGRQRRVLLLISNLSSEGGAEVQAAQLAARLKKRGWDISVVSLMPPVEADAVLAAEDIRVLSLGVEHGADAIRGVVRLAGILKRERPDILHCHMTHAILLGRAARLLAKVPVLVGTLHGLKMYNVSGKGWRFREMLNGVSDRLSDVTTVVCNAAAEHYLSSGAVSGRSLRVLPNGVDTQRFSADPIVRKYMRASLGLGEQDFAWLQVGRFQPVKDHHTMMRAFTRVAARDPRSVLLMAGHGPLRQEIIELAQAMGIGAKVRFLGSRTDIPALMNAADGCVLSSMVEALPMVLLEAAASSVPAVATDVGGVAEIVAEGKSGLLAPPRNPDALAGAMVRLAALPAAEREAMGRQAREHVTANFSLSGVVERWERLYRELLVRKGVTA